MAKLPCRLSGGRSLRQLMRYGIVGVAQNAVGYGVYLFFTWLGADPKLVVGVSYPLAMLVSFLGNKKYTFDHKGGAAGAGGRFLLAHACSYGINLGMLYVCVDRFGYPHQLVQLAAIFVCAVFLFLALKFYVFATRPASARQSS
ncbi:GtrA family protein [Desulfovibrio sp. SGI.169]|uniref:GtrA family protein n=1 Tax=Desulfovibrio sp. SGI.169 TaxID=3420561 RepID=UPI003D0233F7